MCKSFVLLSCFPWKLEREKKNTHTHTHKKNIYTHTHTIHRYLIIVNLSVILYAVGCKGPGGEQVESWSSMRIS